MPKAVRIIGAGLAGSEAAWQIARRGIDVILHEMKPERKSPAHTMNSFAELVCSNSLRSIDTANAVGLLKGEMDILDSLILQAALATRVEAGSALAVDRNAFSDYVTRELSAHPHITIESGEVTQLPPFSPEEPVIVAAGPLCSDALAAAIREITGADHLYFFDAVAPIVSADTIDMSKAFWGSRWHEGTDYINCPMDQEEYHRFYEALLTASRAPIRDFEDERLFSGCMPIECMADKGEDTMRFGPLKPVGIRHPETGQKYYAIVQLRRENAIGSMFNLVGFQTHLRFPEQKRVFSMIPALKNAEFLRFGVMHQNMYLDAPRLLDEHFGLKGADGLYFAGQITGVEGYVESAASGLLAGIFVARRLLGLSLPDFDDETALGALVGHVAKSVSFNYQPMNINFGLMKPLDKKIRNKRERCERLSARAIAKVSEIKRAYAL